MRCDRIDHWFLGRLSTGQNLFKGGASSSKTWTPDWPSIMNLWFQEYNFITGTYFHEGYIFKTYCYQRMDENVVFTGLTLM